MKDENNGTIMTEFWALKLRAKMYAVRVDDKKDTKKVKSVKSNVVARMIMFDYYTRYLNKELKWRIVNRVYNLNYTKQTTR